MPDKESDIFEEFINGMSFKLSEKGLPAPEAELIDDDEGAMPGDIIKISFETILFMNHGKVKYFMLTTNQKMTNMGSMSLKDALIKFNSKRNRKKS